MSNEIAALEAAGQRTEAAFQSLQDHESSWGSDLDSMPAGQRERRQRLTAAFTNANQGLEDARTRAEAIERMKELAKDPRNLETGDGPAGMAAARAAAWAPGTDPAMRYRSDPWAAGSGDNLLRIDSPSGLRQRALDAAEFGSGLTDRGREVLAGVVERDDNALASSFVLALSSPAYRSAFDKVLPDPQRGHLLWTEPERESYARVEAARAAMSLTSANGGYLVPTALDPSVVLTNSGVASPFREFARQVTTTGPTWHGVSSAGIQAEWKSEGAAAADASPTFGPLSVDVHMLSAYVSASYEIFQDSNISEQLPRLLADSFATAENSAFSTGSGSGAPKGIVTAISAVTASRVETTTASTFGLLDLYAAQEALPPRARQGVHPAIFANVTILNRIRQFDTAGGASVWSNLGDGSPERVLGLPLREASGMAATVTTGSYIAVLGDFSQYLIADRLGTTVVPIPAVIDQATGRPSGQFGWHAFKRVGADVLDPGAFRVIKVK